MKQPKPSGCFLSTSNLFVARLHNSSLLGFPGLPWSLQPRKAPFISKASWPTCKYFAVTEGQEKPGLAIFCWAQQALCPALTTLQQVHFLGRCFVDQTYLELTWSRSKHPLPVTPHWLWRGLAPAALGERENTWNCTGLTSAVPGFKPSHLLLGLLCLCTRRTVWNTETASFVDGLPIGDSWVLRFICCPSSTWQHALVRSLHFAAPLSPLLSYTNTRSRVT